MQLVWPLLLLIVGVCHAHPTNGFDEVHDDSERDAWNAGVFTPQPLKAAPWQVDATTTAMPPPTDGLQIPGVGVLHGLQGFKVIKNRRIDAYLGVRYAQVGGGLGRFQQATPVPYQAQIDATRSSSNCAQFPELQRLQEAEARGENVDDCLTLNIYAPSGANQLPVLVFVHGEMLFDGGAEEAQPDYVLEHDVILVSINYRLAPFGFLSALSNELPGNVALADLQLALEWLQRNIRYFGGASNQVTLIGQAGGATLAHALSLSPRTQHLFQQLILQSGTALNPYLIDESPLATLATFAQLAHCPLPARSLVLFYQCLSRMRTSQLVSVFEQLHQQNEPRGLPALGAFKLVVGDALGLLPEHPAALVASSSKNNKTKPMIVGATKDASAFIVSRFYDQIGNLQTQNISDYINVVLRHTAAPRHHKMWHDLALREIFTPDQMRNPNAQKVIQGLLELSNLILYRGPVIDSIRLYHKKSPTYLYTFAYRGEHHRFGHLNNPLPFGVDSSLSDDSVYLFPYPKEASKLNPEDKSLARALVTMWVNFAQSGIPNPNSNVWPRATSEYGPFLRFTNSPQNILELDQHFGEGIYVPNLYPQYLSTANTAAVTSTTTTTTRRPFYNYRPPQQPDYSRPAYNPSWQQQHELEQREQQWRQEEEQKREQRERYERLQREQMQREQFEREQRQREQQQREEIARRQKEEREQQEREQEQREDETGQQQEREQQQREQQQREQQERDQWHRGMPNETEQQREQRLRQQHEREQQERSQEEREQEAREQQEREQQQREELEREQQERDQWQRGMPSETEQQREQRLRQQHEREQQERSQEEREQEAREQQEREQQQREELEREQQEREQQPNQPPAEGPVQELFPTYEDYLKAYNEWVRQEESRYNPQANVSSEQNPLEEDAPINNPYELPNSNYRQYAEAQINPQRRRQILVEDPNVNGPNPLAY
ncbi:glutactin [Drosophila innubila]|uniref:glutactin n=1 Tax=Drosophila innubila TaxID=198719 RepID=UPI00148E2540|nr:glutactin [Drosophila innubila]